ncbi:hypothetical protein CALCODRAFT_361786 [Calocera cornea HHB12733]|uniref:N-acetyltransferase domain-containing protein n=1 Tax=Calocera cornea HHB12733 TaxID=1353952 RepID=A0A165ELK2_9BASI|nr:hypothetical protein CALCODRAFT_361786 [Calocera cornea HHB12733]
MHALAVLPEWHNRGAAAVLFAPMLTRSVQAGRRVLGTTTATYNVSKYLHLGCKLLGVEEFELVPGSAGKGLTRYALEVVPEAFVANALRKGKKTVVVERTLARL